MDIFILLLLIAILVICLVILARSTVKQSTILPQNDGSLELQIALERKLDQMRTLQNEALQKQQELSGLTQLRLSQLISEEMQKISIFQQQTRLANSEQFGEIKTQNLHTLAQIQQFIQTKLNDGLAHIGVANQQNFELLSRTNQEKLMQIQTQVEKKMDEQLTKNLESFGEVQKNLVQMQESAGKMIDSTKSIDKLNTIFSRTSAKSFGTFGEQFLEQFLSDNLTPNTWSKQYGVPGMSGIIDFCITFGEHRIGVDSKFPMTKFADLIDADDTSREAARKDLHTAIKKMADEVAEYEKTGHFAYVMIYFPSDGIYQEVVNSDMLMKYLSARKITPTSPNTILPQLLIVDDYNRKIFINKNAEQIQKGLKNIVRNVESFQNEFRKLGDKLRLAQGNYDDASKNLDGLRGQVHRLESESEEG